MEVYDCLVIGGGPAGITAALYGGRAKLKTGLLDKGPLGGLMLIADHIENYPGFTRISGYELAERMVDSLKQFEVDIFCEEVTELKNDDIGWTIKTANNVCFNSRSVIIATGSTPRQLGVKGEKDLRGCGVSYCAVCDGAFFEGEEVVVVGGGDSAIQEALFLTQYATKVTVVHRRDQLRAVESLTVRALAHPKISFAWNSCVVEILGTQYVERVVLKDVKSDLKRIIPCRAIFIFIGNNPSCEYAVQYLKRDIDGFIITDEELRAGISGLFACGDIRKKHLRQISTAVGDGALAAMSAVQYTKLGK